MERAIAALLSEPTLGAAATLAGASESTLRRWLKDETFSAAYLDARRATLSAAMARLHTSSALAVATLEAIMGDDEAPASARVSAAKTVLELAVRGVELEDIAGRLGALEVEAAAHRKAEYRRRGRR